MVLYSYINCSWTFPHLITPERCIFLFVTVILSQAREGRGQLMGVAGAAWAVVENMVISTRKAEEYV